MIQPEIPVSCDHSAPPLSSEAAAELSLGSDKTGMDKVLVVEHKNTRVRIFVLNILPGV